MAEPDAQGTDGPFATLQRARDAVRDLKKKTTSDIVVLVREGTYALEQTVVFGLEDSGEGDSTVTYAAYPGETPVFSSGREIEGWKEVSGELPGLPKGAQGKVLEANVSGRFLTLYDDEGMLPRAQSERFVPRGSATELNFPKGLLKNWPNVTDVEIVVRPTRLWTMNVLPLVSVDEKAGIARTAIPATYGMNKIGCWVENVVEQLDQPGEWALNSSEGKVYLWPRSESPGWSVPARWRPRTSRWSSNRGSPRPCCWACCLEASTAPRSLASGASSSTTIRRPQSRRSSRV